MIAYIGGLDMREIRVTIPDNFIVEEFLPQDLRADRKGICWIRRSASSLKRTALYH
jgi:hypothetical protein